MSNLGIDILLKKVTSIVNNPSNLINNQINPRNTHLAQPLSRVHKKKKNPHLQSIRSVSNHIANQRSHSPQKENTLPQRIQLLKTRQKNTQSIGLQVPFANATNSKPIKSFSINPTKGKTQLQRQMSQKQSKQNLNSPKQYVRSREISEKPHQQKPSEPTESSRKRIKTYRIHISSSKDKQNNINSNNRVFSTSEQRQLLPIENLQLSTQKSQSYPAIDHDLAKKLSTNRQKTSHSFMIRSKSFFISKEKINSTVLQNQQLHANSKESSNTLHWSKCYRKDKFTKDQIDQVEEVNSKFTNPTNQLFQSTKTNVKQQRAQLQINVKLPTQESQKSTKKLQALKTGKSIKMRKKKFSKPQQDNLVYDQIFTQPNNNEKHENRLNEKFQKSSQDKFQHVKSITVEYQKKKLKEVEQLCMGNNNKQQEKILERVSVDNGEPQLCEINAFYEMMCQYVPLKSRENEKPQKVQQNQLIASKGIKVCKKRVSSIRALKSLYRNAQVQQKAQLAESRNGELSKRREKEAPCLTHKIRWGNQTKRKEGQQQKNQLLGKMGIQKDYHEEYLRLEIETINIEKVQQKKKGLKRARFMEEEVQVEKQGCGLVNNKISGKKSQSEWASHTQSSKPYQSMGSRSMISFQDPGLSVIINKNSSLESYTHVYTTIEQDMQKRDNEQQGQGYKNGKKLRRCEDNAKLQSLNELFLELKSHQSIQMEEQV